MLGSEALEELVGQNLVEMGLPGILASTPWSWTGARLQPIAVTPCAMPAPKPGSSLGSRCRPPFAREDEPSEHEREHHEDRPETLETDDLEDDPDQGRNSDTTGRGGRELPADRVHRGFLSESHGCEQHQGRKDRAEGEPENGQRHDRGARPEVGPKGRRPDRASRRSRTWRCARESSAG